MKNITLFLCDIHGTFDEDASDKEIQQLLENMNKILYYDQTDFLLFSFITTDNIEMVQKIENRLKLYCNNSNIFIGNHIYSDNNRIVNKPCDIINLIDRLNLNYHINDTIYYADDCKFYHDILRELILEFDYNYNIQSIVPVKSGLSDVNNDLIDFLKNKEIKRYK